MPGIGRDRLRESGRAPTMRRLLSNAQVIACIHLASGSAPNGRLPSYPACLFWAGVFQLNSTCLCPNFIKAEPLRQQPEPLRG